MMGILVWLVTYFGLYFGVIDPIFDPEGFAETALSIIVCFLVANFVQALYDLVVGD